MDRKDQMDHSGTEKKPGTPIGGMGRRRRSWTWSCLTLLKMVILWNLMVGSALGIDRELLQQCRNGEAPATEAAQRICLARLMDWNEDEPEMRKWSEKILERVVEYRKCQEEDGDFCYLGLLDLVEEDPIRKDEVELGLQKFHGCRSRNGKYCHFHLIDWYPVVKRPDYRRCSMDHPEARALGICLWELYRGKELENAMLSWWKWEVELSKRQDFPTSRSRFRACRLGLRPDRRSLGICTWMMAETEETALELMQGWWQAWKSPDKDKNPAYMECWRQGRGQRCTWELMTWKQLGRLNAEHCTLNKRRDQKLGVCSWENLDGHNLEQEMIGWWRKQSLKEVQRKKRRTPMQRYTACDKGENPERRALRTCHWLLAKTEEQALGMMKKWWLWRQQQQEENWRRETRLSGLKPNSKDLEPYQVQRRGQYRKCATEHQEALDLGRCHWELHESRELEAAMLDWWKEQTEEGKAKNSSTWENYQGCRLGERPEVRKMGLCTWMRAETPESALDLMQKWWKAWKSSGKNGNRDYKICMEEWPGPHCTWELVGWPELGQIAEQHCNRYWLSSKRLGVCPWQSLNDKDLEQAMLAWWKEEMAREGKRTTKRSILQRVRDCRNGENPERRANGACNWLLGLNEQEALFFMKDWWEKWQRKQEELWRIDQGLEPKTLWGMKRRRRQCLKEHWQQECRLLEISVESRNNERARRRETEEQKRLEEKGRNKKRQMEGTSVLKWVPSTSG